MVARNERKYQVLRILGRFSAITADDLSRLANISINHSRVLLRHYYKQGLINRALTQGGFYIYWLSRKGEERLKWLEAHKGMASTLRVISGIDV